MTIEIKIPALGESVREAVVGEWRFKDGAQVHKDDILVELETDKVTQEIYSPENGVLKITTLSGQTVPIGTVIATLEADQTAVKPSPQPQAASASLTPDSTPEAQEVTGKMPVPHDTPGEKIEPHVASPLARKVAPDLGVDYQGVKGTGPAGLVTRADVEREKAETPKSRKAEREEENAKSPKRQNAETQNSELKTQNLPTPSTQPPTAEITGETPVPQRRQTREPIPTLRKRIAERLVEAQHTAAMLTTFNEADCSTLVALRKKYKEDFEKVHGAGLGFMSFFVAAACSALKAVPRLNAQIHTDISGKSEIVQFHYVDCGIAVNTDRGLMVPVLRSAERMSLSQIELAVKDLAARAREGKISVEELSGGTFTITNGGVFGSLLSTPILNPPQSGILGMHKIQDRPIAVDGQVTIRPMMYLALTYDHRLVDGAEAVRFLIHVKEIIENPERLLLEI